MEKAAFLCRDGFKIQEEDEVIKETRSLKGGKMEFTGPGWRFAFDRKRPAISKHLLCQEGDRGSGMKCKMLKYWFILTGEEEGR